MRSSLISERARHFSTRCGFYEVANVVHGNRSDNDDDDDELMLNVLRCHLTY